MSRCRRGVGRSYAGSHYRRCSVASESDVAASRARGRTIWGLNSRRRAQGRGPRRNAMRTRRWLAAVALVAAPALVVAEGEDRRLRAQRPGARFRAPWPRPSTLLRLPRASVEGQGRAQSTFPTPESVLGFVPGQGKLANYEQTDRLLPEAGRRGAGPHENDAGGHVDRRAHLLFRADLLARESPPGRPLPRDRAPAGASGGPHRRRGAAARARRQGARPPRRRPARERVRRAPAHHRPRLRHPESPGRPGDGRRSSTTSC